MAHNSTCKLLSSLGLALILGGLLVPRAGYAQDAVDAGFASALNGFVTWLEGAGLDIDTDIDQNGIADLDHAALLDYVLATPSVSCHPVVKAAYLTNLAIAQNQTPVIESSDLYVLMTARGTYDFAKLLAGAVTLGEPNTFHIIQSALLRIYPNFNPDANLIPGISMENYPAMDSPLAAWGDADGDGVENIREWKAAADQAAFINAATNPGVTASDTDPSLHITSVTGFGQTVGAEMTGVVENLPGDGTGYLLTFLSKNDDTYYSRPTGSGFLQPVSNGVPWQFSLLDARDPYAVRIVCFVVPSTSTPTDCATGYCDEVPVPDGVLASATVIRSPLADPSSKGLGLPPVYHALSTDIVGSGAVYVSPADAGQFLAGTPLTVRARASLGWRFVRWEGDYPVGEQLVDEIDLVMDAPHELTAYFQSETAAAEALGSGPVDIFVSYTWEVEEAELSGPFTIVNDNYVVQQEATELLADSGRMSFQFTIAEAGVYIVKARVNAPNSSSNSFALNIDREPFALPQMQWDIPPTTGFQRRTASWRGSGTETGNQYDPKYFSLAAGTHELIIRGRERGVALDHVTIEKVLEGHDLWVDFTHSGSEDGTYEKPFHLLGDALSQVSGSESIGISGGKSGEVLRITAAARLGAPSGAVRLGDMTASNMAQVSAAMAAATILAGGNQPVDMKAILDAILANYGQGGGGGGTGVTAGDLAERASKDNIHDAPTFEPVMPYSMAPESAARMARVDSTLALRLRSDSVIDPDSIVLSLPAYETGAYEVLTRPAVIGDVDKTDMWVLLRPTGYWYYDDTFDVQVNAGTASAAFTFVTESEASYLERTAQEEPPLWQPVPDEDYVAEGLVEEQELAGAVELEMLDAAVLGEPLSGGIGVPYAIGPEAVFETPQRVWLPIPEGMDPNGVALYYHKAHGEDAGWYPAERVEGLLDPGSYLNLPQSDGSYLGFLARHGGVVQLGVTSVDLTGTPFTSGTTSVPRIMRTRPYGYMLMALWLVAAILSTVVYLNAYQLQKQAKKFWMRLGLVLQNEDGPFYGKACWSGYYKDNQGIWQLDRRKNPDRRRLRVPTPAELDMRKTVRREIDRRIQEWGEPASTR